MLIASLLPLLTRYSLGLDLIAGEDGTVTLTVIPRKAVGATRTLETTEIRSIAITATAAEIDAELARGIDGALGQLFTARKTLADQLVEQREAAEAAKVAAVEAARTKAATATLKPAAPVAPKAPAVTSPPADADPDAPASLW